MRIINRIDAKIFSKIKIEQCPSCGENQRLVVTRRLFSKRRGICCDRCGLNTKMYYTGVAALLAWNRVARKEGEKVKQDGV